MSAIGKLSAVILDCPEPAVLAEFYQRLTGMAVGYRDDDLIYLGDDSGVQLGFQRVAGYTAPGWPDDAKQAHVDVSVADVEVAVKELTALGATVPEFQPGDGWTVLADPAGHLFCVSAG
ncbi:VOC family protein [Phytomonospora endophytica]|uniref:Catechol 2,3-dioxygenase-like lactoylglutathione lyase family enzyme n=1 Tax=Phytomonospora endophytica TaxID=714109 RepID=A0A841FK63_9ACTN|nr:VOC family protein [Phytomonospora endophytica]MBB6033029.1 catechol 2,3-dioxygenase-like lactoylglutathione lyase family enzyme [Phytomonospora endophytica]GIG65255.1 glyoxalase [Phytomonospora endophytica]